mgnify:CR=1 FL=1
MINLIFDIQGNFFLDLDFSAEDGWLAADFYTSFIKIENSSHSITDADVELKGSITENTHPHPGYIFCQLSTASRALMARTIFQVEFDRDVKHLMQQKKFLHLHKQNLIHQERFFFFTKLLLFTKVLLA